MRSVRTNSRVPASFDEPTADDYTHAASSRKRAMKREMLLFCRVNVIYQTPPAP